MLLAPGFQEHGLALAVTDNRQRHLLELGRQSATLGETSPSGDGGVHSDQVDILDGRKANGCDVGLEIDGLLQPHQRQIVLIREEIVFGVDDLLAGGPLHVSEGFLGVAEVVLAQSQPDLRHQQVLDAVTGRDDPQLVEQRPTAAMRRREPEEGRPSYRHLPRPGAEFRRAASHDPPFVLLLLDQRRHATFASFVSAGNGRDGHDGQFHDLLSIQFGR